MKAPGLSHVIATINNLKEDVLAGRVKLGAGNTYNSDKTPCCVLGHLYERCGHEAKNNIETVRPLIEALGLKVEEMVKFENIELFSRLQTFVRGCWSQNDLAIYGKLPEAAANDMIAKALELLKQNLIAEFA